MSNNMPLSAIYLHMHIILVAWPAILILSHVFATGNTFGEEETIRHATKLTNYGSLITRPQQSGNYRAIYFCKENEHQVPKTEIMRSEFERMQQRQPMDVLSMKRYELPPPPAGKLTDVAAWTECVDNSMAQLEHQATRICNLELMLDYGCEAWKSYLSVLVKLSTQAQKQLQSVRKMIQETNWERKSMQTSGGERLRALEASWVGLVSKNYEIEQACAQMEKELMNALRKKQTQQPNKEESSLPEGAWESAEAEQQPPMETQEDEMEEDNKSVSPERDRGSSEASSPRQDEEEEEGEQMEDQEDDNSR